MFSFAPHGSGQPQAVRACSCGMLWELDESAAEEVDVARREGKSLPPSHWGDEAAGGGWVDIATQIVPDLTLQIVTVAAKLAVDRWRDIEQRQMKLPKEIAAEAARRRITSSVPAFTFDMLAATQVRHLDDGWTEVGVVSESFNWKVKVRRYNGAIDTMITEEPVWVPQAEGDSNS